MTRKTPTDRAVIYSRRVAPEATMQMVNQTCICSQCVARRAWLAGFNAGRRTKGKGE